jgi:hypothetical protein
LSGNSVIRTGSIRAVTSDDRALSKDASSVIHNGLFDITNLKTNVNRGVLFYA